MGELKEIDVMKSIASALENLDEEERRRVLNWAIDKFDVTIRKPSETGDVVESIEEEENKNMRDGPNDFETVADLYFACSPSTDAEKALVIGYWFQFIESESDFDALSVNNELKHLGHQIGNITRAFNQLQRKKPQLAYQTRKQGSTKQARKRYKLTKAGQVYIEDMLE